MRMDLDRINQPSAAEILANIDEDSLVRVLKVIFLRNGQRIYFFLKFIFFKVYGEEKQAKKISRAIIEGSIALNITHLYFY